MFYVAVDQHSKQLTVRVRDEAGDVLLRRQVSTQWQRVRQFWAEIREWSVASGGFVVILEVCGFNDWLVTLLREYGCSEIVLVQADERSKTKTDRRDANRLGELLWVNRQRLRAGQRVPGLKRVQPPSATDAEHRQLTGLRQRLVAQRTRTINRVRHLLLKHNLSQECPTKGIQTLKAWKWLRAWSRQVKQRRGAKIARVAVMRRLAVSIWHMLKHQQPYCCGGPEAVRRQREQPRAVVA